MPTQPLEKLDEIPKSTYGTRRACALSPRWLASTHRAIHCLSFSKDGNYLASVGQDEFHSVAVYNWKEKRLLFAHKSTRSKVFDCHFISNSSFVTCGVNHIHFWESQRAGVYSQKKGLFGKLGKMQTITCASNLEDGRVVSGSLSGHLYVWAGRNCQKMMKAHDTTINALYSCSHGLLSSKDGKVRLWTQKMEPGATFDLSGVEASDHAFELSLGLRMGKNYWLVPWEAKYTKFRLKMVRICTLVHLSRATASTSCTASQNIP